VLYGYQVIRAGAPAERVTDGVRLLKHFALREGFALGPVFVERPTDRPGSTLAAVIAAARRSSAIAVAVPTADDLGLTPRMRWLTRFWLEHEGRLRVLIVESNR
jgi:hypothetical protein